MALLKGMRRRALSALLCAGVLCSSCGCGVADYLRPDLNHNAEVHVFPPYLDPDPSSSPSSLTGVDENDVRPGPNAEVWPNGSPNIGGFQYRPLHPDVNAENFEGTRVDTIGADNYSDYLREQVYDPVVAIIAGLDPEIQDKIYIRFGHTGYNYDKTTRAFYKAHGWSDTTDGKFFKTHKYVGGDTLLTLATDWVGHLSQNVDQKQIQVDDALRTITSYMSAEDMNKNWQMLAGSRLPGAYYQMFGREGTGFVTLQDYYDAISRDPYRNIPNFSLYFYTGTSTTDRMVFNEASGVATTPYVPGVPLDTVNKLFRTYNQYPTRDREICDNKTTDNDSILRYHLDGYTKTIMFIGTVAGGNLKETIGEEAYGEIYTLIMNAYDCTQCAEIKAIKPEEPIETSAPEESDEPDENREPETSPEPAGPDYSGFYIIPAGTKGVD